MKPANSLLCAAPMLFTLVAHAQTTQNNLWAIDPMHSQANFEIRHLGVSNVRGTLSHVQGTVNWDEKDPSKSSVVADIDASTINTATEKRDSHLKSAEFFNVASFPTLHFQSTSIHGSNGKLQVVGDLTLAGVTKPVTLDVDGPVAPQKGQQGGLVTGFSATGLLKRSDFNFGQKYLPPFIGDEVKLTLDVEIGQK